VIFSAVMDFCTVAAALLIAYFWQNKRYHDFIAVFISCSEIIKCYYNTATFTRTSCEDRIRIPRSYMATVLGFTFPGFDNFFSQEADAPIIACDLGTKEIFHRPFSYILFQIYSQQAVYL